MKNDPSIPDADTRKKFMFYDTAKRQADLKIRLEYDGMNHSSFFRAMITGYLEQAREILSYLDKYKASHQIQGKNKRDASKRIYNKSEQVKKQFALDNNDIQGIFDLLEQENPDL